MSAPPPSPWLRFARTRMATLETMAATTTKRGMATLLDKTLSRPAASFTCGAPGGTCASDAGRRRRLGQRLLLPLAAGLVEVQGVLHDGPGHVHAGGALHVL